jgi:transcriptional regulator with XRE-family HTH domain
MEKEKLRELRKKMQVSQKEMADILCIDVSNYNKREKGICKITSSEWQLLAKKLNVTVDDIYEDDDFGFYKNNNKNGIIGNNNNYNATNETVIITLNKYISKLEVENTTLKTENSSLKEEIAFLRKQVGKTSP